MNADEALRRLMERNRRSVVRYGVTAASREADRIINALLALHRRAECDLTDTLLLAMGGPRFKADVRALPVEWQRLLVEYAAGGRIDGFTIDSFMCKCRLALRNIANYRRELSEFDHIDGLGLPPGLADRLKAMQVRVLAEGYGHTFALDDADALEIYTGQWTAYLENYLKQPYGKLTYYNQD